MNPEMVTARSVSLTSGMRRASQRVGSKGRLRLPSTKYKGVTTGRPWTTFEATSNAARTQGGTAARAEVGGGL